MFLIKYNGGWSIPSHIAIKKGAKRTLSRVCMRNVTHFNTGFSLFLYQAHLTFIIGLKGWKEYSFSSIISTLIWCILPSSPGHLGKLLTRFKLRSRLHVIRESTFERNKESKKDAFIMYGPGEMYVCLQQALSLRYLLNWCIYKYPSLCVSVFPQNRIGFSMTPLVWAEWNERCVKCSDF